MGITKGQQTQDGVLSYEENKNVNVVAQLSRAEILAAQDTNAVTIITNLLKIINHRTESCATKANNKVDIVAQLSRAEILK
jgi:hypothetical protein